MNAAYVAALKSCLCLRESVGIIGGKPNHAYYFIGFIGKYVHKLDLIEVLPDSLLGEKITGMANTVCTDEDQLRFRTFPQITSFCILIPIKPRPLLC